MGRSPPAPDCSDASADAPPPVAAAAPERSPELRRGPVERLAAWLVTGPLGHLYATLADIAVLWGAWARTRLAEGASAREDRD